MRVLLDHCVDRRLRRFLPAHEIMTAREIGWAELTNGELLRKAAEAQFDVVLTVDRKIKYEHNLDSLPVAILQVGSGDTRLSALIPLVPAIENALSELVPRSLSEIIEPLETAPDAGIEGPVHQ